MFWGDDIHTDPGDLHRVYSQNVEGTEMTPTRLTSMSKLCISSMLAHSAGLTRRLTSNNLRVSTK